MSTTTSKQEMTTEQPVAVHFTSFKGVIKVPFEMIVKILFLYTALFAGMKETRDRKIKVEYETHLECARAYFSMKWFLLGKNEKDPSENWDPQLLDDVLKLAQFFQDEEIIDTFNDRASTYLDKYFSKKCICDANCSTYAIVKQRSCTCFKSFWVRLHSFITEDPLFAQWIWERIHKDTLLQYIEAPKKRINTLSNTEFHNLPKYIDLCSDINQNTSDPKLDKMYRQLDQVEIDDEGTYAAIKSKIELYERAKQRALNRSSRANSNNENDQKRINTLTRMAQNGAFP